MPRAFHARHSAVSRSYLYQISRRRTAFAKPFVWWVKDRLDVAAMRAGADAFVGMHDFRAFSDDDPAEKSTQVLLDDVQVAEFGALVVIRVAGSHFLWKMVRRMVGVLAAVGAGDLEAGDVAVELARRGRTRAGRAHGDARRGRRDHTRAPRRRPGQRTVTAGASGSAGPSPS